MVAWKALPPSLVAAGLAFALATVTPPAHGQPTGAVAPTGLDLVILIDQSGSMWGHPKWHPVPNDRFQHRIGVAREIVERLLADVWATPTVHRFSVVDFGDRAEVAWSDQELRYDPGDPEALGRRIKVLLGERVCARPWINTNTPQAMELARQELARMSREEPRTGRRRIVLLITDGRPDVPGVPLSVLRSRASTEARLLSAMGGELWVIGIDDGDRYWLDEDGEFWEGLAGPGHARLAKTAAAALPPIVGDVVDGWLGTSGRPAAGLDHYDAPPYLGRLTFRVNFLRPRGEVHILDPTGFELARVAGDPDLGTYAHYSREDPPPGRYRIQQEGGTRIYIEETPPRIERLAPGSEADAGAPVRAEFAVKTSGGQPLGLLAAWPLSVRLHVVPPHGTAYDLPAANPRPDLFTATWSPGVAGSYRLELHGFVRLPDGSQRDVFAGGAEAYPRLVQVSRREPYSLRLSAPQSAAHDLALRLAPWTHSATLGLALDDPHGHPVSRLAAVVHEPATWLALQRVDPSGVPIGPPAQVVPDAAGALTATLPITQSLWAAAGLGQPGRIYLKVVARPGRLGAGTYLRGLALPPAHEDRRVASDPLSVGPIDLLPPLWLVALRWLAGTALLALALALLCARGLPALLIRHEDGARAGGVRLKIYDAVADPSALSALVLPVGNGRHFKLDRQVSFPLDGQRVVAERFRVTRLASARKARARLDYSWQGRRDRHRAELTAGSYRLLEGLPESGGRTVVMLSEGRASAD